MILLEQYLNSFHGADLLLHFVVGGLVSIISLKSFNLNGIGIYSATVLGIFKELWDFHNSGYFAVGSISDLTITILAGIIVELLWKQKSKLSQQ